MNKVKEKLKKIWEVIRASKLNMGMFITGVIAFILLVSIFGVVIFRGGAVDNTLIVTRDAAADATTEGRTTKPVSDKNTPDEEYSTKIDESATTNVVKEPELLRVSLEVTKSWHDNGEYYVQYDMGVTNVSGKDVDGWAAVFDMTSSYELVDSWNFSFKEGYKKLVVNPTSENKDISEDGTVNGGFIIKGKNQVNVDYYTVYLGKKTETVKNNSQYVQKPTKDKETTDSQTTTLSDETTTPDNEEVDTTVLETTTEPETTTDNPASETTTQETTTADETTTVPEGESEQTPEAQP